MHIYNHNNLFLDNKYTKWYYSIIERAQSQDRKKLRKTSDPNYVYYEEHHVLPKAKDLFPEYANLKTYPWNGVLLNAKEHYICHALLCKMTRGRALYKMLTAFDFMNIAFGKNTPRYTSRLYQYFKYQLHTSEYFNEHISEYFSNSIWINNGSENKRIPDDSIIPEGYVRGRHDFNYVRKVNDPTIWITNGTSNKRIKEKTTIPEGWWRGRIVHKEYKKQEEKTIWINNGNINQRLNIKNELPEGWTKGRILDDEARKKMYNEESSRKISESRSGAKQSDDCKQLLKYIVSGKKHYNNGIVGIHCYPEDVPEGFEPGKVKVVCEFCGLKYTKGNLKQHINKYHKDSITPTVQKDETKEKTQRYIQEI